MKGLGVRTQLLLVLLVPLFIFAPLALAVFYEGVRREVTHELDIRAELLARQTASVVVDDVLTGDHAGADRRLSDVLGANTDIAYVFVVDARGRVSAHTFGAGFPADLLAVIAPSSEPGRPRLVDLGGQAVHDVRAPILGGTAGWVHLGISASASQKAAREVFALRLGGIGLGIVVVGVGLALLFSGRMLRRLDEVTRAAASVGSGELETRLSDLRDDEIGRLGGAFNDMAARLADARDERERNQQRLAQSESLAAVGRLAAGVAHEMNNPLSGVLHCLDNLREEDSDRERRMQYYGLMADGVGRAQRVIRRMLDLSRHHELEIAPVDVRDLVDQVVSLLEPTLSRAEVRAEVRHDETLPQVPMDRHQMGQVLINLVLNAAEAMPRGGLVEIESARSNGHCRLRVRDHGVGISEAFRAKLFEPFHTTKGSKQGTGLGLAVSLAAVERHGGRMEVASEPGQGATFDVLLPMGAPASGSGEHRPHG